MIKWAVKHSTRDEEINKHLVYFFFAREFGFTPKQVDEMDSRLVEEFIVILNEIGSKEVM